MIDRVTTPNSLAKQLGVRPQKVLGWIARGELRAINMAATTAGRPRWKILPEDLERFFDSRAATAPPPKPRRRKRRAVVSGRERY